MGLKGSTITANCPVYAAASLDLNTAITNTEGVLSFKNNGNFAASSKDLKLKGHELHAQAQKSDKSYVKAILNLSTKITNRNGVLVLDA